MGAQFFFLPTVNWEICSKSQCLATRFSPTAARPFLFVILHTLFAPRPPAAQSFFSFRFFGFAPQQLLNSLPRFVGSRLFAPKFLPRRSMAVFFFAALRAAFFQRLLRSRYSVMIRAPETPHSTPLGSSRRFAPRLTTAAARPFFNPEQVGPFP